MATLYKVNPGVVLMRINLDSTTITMQSMHVYIKRGFSNENSRYGDTPKKTAKGFED